MSIEGILLRQGGVISRDQAVAAGMSPGTVDDRLRRRRWRPVHPQVYLATGRPADPEVRVRAAVLWAGAEGVLAGAAAAWWCGLLDRAPPTVTVLVPGPAPARTRSGIVVLTRALDPDDVIEHRGLPVTARASTVLDAAVELGPAGGPLLDRVLQGGLALHELHEAYRRRPTASARRQLAAAAERSAVTARRRLRQLLHGSGPPGWRARAGPLAAVEFPGARVAVEVAGWAQPFPPFRSPDGDPPGWTTLRYPWSALAARPQATLDEITATVTAARVSFST